MSETRDVTGTESEQRVAERYARAARAREEKLCCAVDYRPEYLDPIPAAVIERDYGCGDPSRYVRPGDRVLDLGSGGGKICFIAAQIAGAGGSVLGIDMNREMLALARGAAPVVAERIGYANVRFARARIQDLALDIARLETRLARDPVASGEALAELERWQDEERAHRPLVPDDSVDLVVSNCVLNLVREDHKSDLLREIGRVVRPGGRIAISDIVSDRPVPASLQSDAELWSGCVSGAFEASELIEGLGRVGFEALAFDKWEEEPFRVVEGITFRSVTVTGVRPGGIPTDAEDDACCGPASASSG